eukprot:8292557-Alexandrium_andersonii.AAC.1
MGARCGAHLDPLGLHVHTCPGQTRRHHDDVERALKQKLTQYGLTVDQQPRGKSYEHIPDFQIAAPVNPGTIYA